jgi:hypothetical protein
MASLGLLRALRSSVCLALVGLLLIPAASCTNGTDMHKPCHAERNFKTVSGIYNLTVYPNQLPVLLGTAPPEGLFNHSVVGRVDPVGDFEGFQDSIEYFFALAPVPQTNPAFAAITSYKITSFTSGCPGVAASVVYLYCNVINPGSPDDGKAIAPLKQVSLSRVSCPMC